MEMVKRVQSKNENPELIQDRYEAEELKIADSIDSIPAKRDASKLTPDNYKKKKPKMDKEADLSDFSSVMEYGNQLKDQYDEEAKINKTVRSELLVKNYDLFLSEKDNNSYFVIRQRSLH